MLSVSVPPAALGADMEADADGRADKRPRPVVADGIHHNPNAIADALAASTAAGIRNGNLNSDGSPINQQ